MENWRKVVAVLCALGTCILLFVPWGNAVLGGEVKIRNEYSNPIVVEGSYPRGVADALRTFSNELDGFQEQCELMHLCIMTALIFLAVLKGICAGAILLFGDRARPLCLVAEVLVLVPVVLAIVAGFVLRDFQVNLSANFRLVAEVGLNPVPFLIVITEITGMNICSKKKR